MKGSINVAEGYEIFFICCLLIYRIVRRFEADKFSKFKQSFDIIFPIFFLLNIELISCTWNSASLSAFKYPFDMCNTRKPGKRIIRLIFLLNCYFQCLTRLAGALQTKRIGCPVGKGFTPSTPGLPYLTKPATHTLTILCPVLDPFLGSSCCFLHLKISGKESKRKANAPCHVSEDAINYKQITKDLSFESRLKARGDI